ncbi:arginine--tRNA ligase [Helicobacter aurati]|uniref:Arginine--tRNA ligase n=1 Tax=Helicobacter aurati TaxID=137778 RepID=A0A3D8J1G7_9HELI|nr:arginine--tRNA ligase [Helicobacter aurati]RDU71005.1 arginine--tRNA ligase [Helicobacter aurati]
MYYKVKAILIECINQFVQTNVSTLYKNIGHIQDVPLGYPKDRQHGHFATTISFVFAKKIHRNPQDIANDIAVFLREKTQEEYISRVADSKETSLLGGYLHGNPILIFEEVTSLGGYLNFKLSFEFFEYMINTSLALPQDFGREASKNHKALLEYVSANPTGPLHIGHARGAIFGNALQRIGQHLGYEIISEYYVNDAGSQIDMLALSVFNAAANILNLAAQEGEVYKGEYIDRVAQEAISYFGKQYFCKDFHSISQNLGLFAKDMMLKEIQSNLNNVGIFFQNFVSEKSLYSKWQDTLAILENNSALYRKQGAIWLKSSLKGDAKDRVLVRENGEPTYMAGDIVYHKDKFERGFDSYINIWGADHHGYIARIKASIEFMNYDSGKLEVLLVQMVSLLQAGLPYKMSKRAGNFILMEDIVNEIGADSLKFIFLSKSLDTHLEFDVDILNKQDSSNPVFYINYANARIHTLLEKSTFSKRQILSASLHNVATTLDSQGQSSLKEELANLIVSALSFSYVVRQSYEEHALHKICEYLKNLAKQLHAFYNAYRILQTPFEAQILKVFMLVSLSFSTGFSLLGITIKTKM